MKDHILQIGKKGKKKLIHWLLKSANVENDKFLPIISKSKLMKSYEKMAGFCVEPFYKNFDELHAYQYI